MVALDNNEIQSDMHDIHDTLLSSLRRNVMHLLWQTDVNDSQCLDQKHCVLYLS